MVVFIAILILGYAMFYSGLSKWLTNGQGVTFFQALGINPSLLTVSTIHLTSDQVFPMATATPQFIAQSAPLFGTPSNTNTNVVT